MKTILLSLSVLTFGTITMYAQEPKDTTSLEELLVTAPIKTNVALTPMDVTVVSSEQIDKSTESSLLPVLQNHIPGMFVSERGMEGYGVSGGAAGTVNIRGIGGGNQVLFMIDGIPTWAGVFGHSNPDTYVANGVEKVEVVKGPASLLYGSGAMGGSVNIITKHQKKDGFSGRARAMFGSYYTSKFNLMTGFKKDKISAVVSGQLDRSDNNRPGSDFWLANEYIQLQYTPSSHWSVGTNVDMTQSTANNPGSVYVPLDNMWTSIFRGNAQIYANNTYERVHGGVQAYINWGRHKLDDGNTPGTPENHYLFNLTDYNMGFSIFETVNPWVGNDLSVGVDFQHWGGHIWNSEKENVYDPENLGKAYSRSESWHNENDIAGYLMMQQSFIRDILSLNAGVRLQHNSVYGNVWVPQAGFIIRPVNLSEIKFSFSKGFRSPNIRELYLYMPANDELKPEYLNNFELSYRQTVCEGKLNFGAALFFIDAKNIIQTVDRKNVNTGKFKNKGFELDATWHFASRWQLYGGYAYLHTTKSGLYYAPKNKLDLSLSFAPGNFDFTLENNNIWSLYNGNPDGTVSYSLVNLRAAYTHPSNVPVTFFVKADNLFDKKYEVVYGFPMPGITVMGGVDFKF